MLHDNLKINEKNHLTLNGADTVNLSQKYGTPLYLLDENRIRSNIKLYIDTMKACFREGSRPLFASKALSFKEIYRIASSEGMAVDAVSPGEIYTAVSAGINPTDIFFHGNAKTVDDINFALDKHIGYFVVDNETELERIDKLAGERGIKQKILLRLTPGIDPHTFDAVNTGKVDSKFGSAIATGQAEDIFNIANKLSNIDLRGFHCHIGSQIFDEKPFCDAADIMLRFIIYIRDKYKFTTEILNLGGGFGVRYNEQDKTIDIRGVLEKISRHIEKICAVNNFPQPIILLEPGRSIVADAGVTLYTVQSIKQIPGFRKYVCIDGGMADNPRYALYKSKYTFLIANRANENCTDEYTVAGRCCESGDLLGEGISLPYVNVGDTLAVLVTGAYNYSMSSNYNLLPKCPIVIIKDGIDRLSVKGESFEDIIKNQL